MTQTVTRYLKAKEVWERFGVSRTTFYRGLRTGFYPPADLEDKSIDKNGDVKLWRRWSLELILSWESTKQNKGCIENKKGVLLEVSK